MFPAELLALAYGLASALSWGTGDFSGGLASKSRSVFTVLLYSQMISGAMLVLAAIVMAEQTPSVFQLFMGGLAGICGTAGLAALYMGLATGRMGIVAPVSAVVSAILPIAVSAFTEGLPDTAKVIGFVAALAAVCFLSYQKDQGRFDLKSLTLPVVAGLCFGLFFVIIGRLSSHAVLWPLASARITSVLLLIVFLSSRGRLEPLGGSGLGLILLTGLFETGGNVFYALASSLGRLDISAVLASLYPAATVLLAGIVLKEKLSGRHWAGVASALAALVLIAA